MSFSIGLNPPPPIMCKIRDFIFVKLCKGEGLGIIVKDRWLRGIIVH